MNTSLNNKKFIKSKTFIIFTSLASLLFVLFMFSVINMGIRYDFFRVTLNSNNLYESEAIWKVMLSNLSNTTFEEISEELKLNWDLSVIENIISTLTTKFKDVNMNLGYTVMTIVFVSGFVVCGFVPLAYWMCELSKKRQKKAKKEVKTISK